MINTPAKIMSILAALTVVFTIAFVVHHVQERKEAEEISTSTTSRLTRSTVDWREYDSGYHTTITTISTTEETSITTEAETTTTTTSIIASQPSIIEQYKNQIEQDIKKFKNARYYLYNVDNKGRAELITESINNNNESVYKFYTYKNNVLAPYCSVPAIDGKLYVPKNGNGLIIVYNNPNEFKFQRITLIDNRYSVETIASGNHTIESSENIEQNTTIEDSFSMYLDKYCDNALNSFKMNDYNILWNLN